MSLVRTARTPNGGDFAADVAGFLIGIGIAWSHGWRTDSLIWSLWLASLGVGYATLVLTLVRAKNPGSTGFGATRNRPRNGVPNGGSVVTTWLAKLFLLGFFTVHFGLFHFVHSVFLNLFFPAGGIATNGPTHLLQRFVPDYGVVLEHCWPWLLAAAIAERRNLWPRQAHLGTAMAAPYANVVRLHLLIFFFAGALAIGLAGAVVNVVVQAVYFWPWRRSFVVTPPAPATS